MAIAELFTVTEAVGATEHSLTTDTSGPDAQTTAGIYQLFVDTSDMVAGDELRLRAYEKVLSSSTQRRVWEATLTGIQSQDFVSEALVLMHGWDFTAQTMAGTSITVTASVRQVA